MIQPYDLLTALDLYSLMLFFWFTLLFDLPRYIISAIALACVPWQSPPPKRFSTSAIVAGHNEAKTIRQCVRSLEVDEVIAVDDGSTDDMWLEVQRLQEEGPVAKAIRLPSRQSKPAAVNAGLALCSGEIVLIIDADTVLAPGAVAAALGYFSDPKVGGVNFNLQVRNEGATLTTRLQAIEYSIAISVGKRMADAFGILPNVSGAAGAFRRSALEQVGGQDIEVAEDAALSMKLRDAGWRLRFAPDAIASTVTPETMVALLLQRLRWDSSIITIWWRKHARNLNPFGRHFSFANMWTNRAVVLRNPAARLTGLRAVALQFGRRGLDHVFADRVPRTVRTRRHSMRRHVHSSEVLALRALLRDRAESRDEASAHDRARARTHAANLTT